MLNADVFSDFETGLADWEETTFGASPAVISAVASPEIGGSQAMKVTQTGDGFSWDAEMAGGLGSDFQTLMEAALLDDPAEYRIEFDVHYQGAEMPITAFANLSVALQDDNDVGWSEVHGEGIYGSGEIGTDVSLTVALPLSAFQGGVDASLDAGSDWYKIVIAMNGDWGTGDASVYFDNFRIETGAAPVSASQFDFEAGLAGWGLVDFGTDAAATVALGASISATGDAMCLGRSANGFSWVGGVEENPGDAFYDSVNSAVNSGNIEDFNVVFDVIYLASDFPAGSGTYANLSVGFNDEVSGFTTLDGFGLYGAADFGTDKSITVAVPLDELGVDEVSDWYQLVIGSNGDWSGAATGTIYVDNLRLVEGELGAAYDFETGEQGWSLVDFAEDTGAATSHGLGISASGNALCLERSVNDFSWVAQVTAQAGSIFYDQIAAAVADDPASYMLELDVIYLATEFPEASGTFVNTSVAFNDNDGWTDVHGEGNYGEADFGLDITVPISIPLSDLGIDPASEWYQINIGTNGDWDASATGTVHIDNVRVAAVAPIDTGVLTFTCPTIGVGSATGVFDLAIGFQEASDATAAPQNIAVEAVSILGNELEITLSPTTGLTRYSLPGGGIVEMQAGEVIFRVQLEESADLNSFSGITFGSADTVSMAGGEASVSFNTAPTTNFFRFITLAP